MYVICPKKRKHKQRQGFHTDARLMIRDEKAQSQVPEQASSTAAVLTRQTRDLFKAQLCPTVKFG